MYGIGKGISNVKKGGNFFTGKGRTDEVLASDMPDGLEGDAVEYSNKSADKFYKNNFDAEPGLKSMKADGSLPSSKYRMEGDKVFNVKTGKEVLGVTTYDGKQGSIFLYKGAFSNSQKLYLTMGHELMHVRFNFNGLGLYGSAAHKVIGPWETNQKNIWNGTTTPYTPTKYDKYLIPYRYDKP